MYSHACYYFVMTQIQTEEVSLILRDEFLLVLVVINEFPNTMNVTIKYNSVSGIKTTHEYTLCT